MPKTNGVAILSSTIGMTPTTLSAGVIENPMVKVRPISDNGPLLTNQREHVPMSADPFMIGHGVVSPKVQVT